MEIHPGSAHDCIESIALNAKSGLIIYGKISINRKTIKLGSANQVQDFTKFGLPERKMEKGGRYWGSFCKKSPFGSMAAD